MGSPRRLNKKRVEAILEQQHPSSFCTGCQPPIKAKREEAANGSRPAEVWSEQLRRDIATYNWSSGSVVVRAGVLRSEAPDRRIHPEGVPLHGFVAECQDARRRLPETWRLDQPPFVEPFDHRAQRALMIANRRTKVDNVSTKSRFSRREGVPGLVDATEAAQVQIRDPRNGQ